MLVFGRQRFKQQALKQIKLIINGRHSSLIGG
jgi:hypothetical protein